MANIICSILLGTILLTTVVLPSAIVAFGVRMSTGLFGVAVLYILLFLPIRKIYCKVSLAIGFLIVVGNILLAVFFHGLICAFANQTFDFYRFTASCSYLLLFLAGAFSFSALFDKVRPKDAHGAITFVFFLLLFVGLMGVWDYSPWFETEKPVVFFSEPSHFSLIFLPFLLSTMLMWNQKARFFLLMGTLVLGIFLENLTLLAGLTVIIFIVFNLRKILYLVAILAVLIALSSADGIRYYLARLDLSPQSTNLSVLVYLNGWERAYLNLKESDGLGIGFNQLGFSGVSGQMAERLKQHAGKELNSLDGGFIAGKLISEFGVAGIALLFIYTISLGAAIKRMRYLARIKDGKDAREVFFLACYVMFAIDLFVRGTGYFSSASFLFIAGIIWIVLSRYRNYVDTFDAAVVGKNSLPDSA